MALIRATCEDCGDVELRSHHLTIAKCVSERYELTYFFNCPVCMKMTLRELPLEALGILVQAGVKVNEYEAPTDSVRASVQVLPQFNTDDQIDLHELLEQPINIVMEQLEAIG